MRLSPLTDMTLPVRALAMMVAVLFSGVTQASATSESIVRTSPLGEIIQQYPAMMSQGIRDGLRQTGQVEPIIADTIGGIVSRAFNTVDIRNQVVNNLDKGLSEPQLQSVQDWYDTKLGRRITSAEIAASKPAAWQDLQAQSGQLIDNSKGTDRETLFADFDKASRATESTVDTAIAVQMGLASAMSAMRGGNGPTFDQMKQQIESQRSTLRAAVEQQVYAAYLYTYRDFSTDEIRQYLDFLKTESGARYNKVVTDSIQKAVMKPIESVGNQLVRLLNPGAPPAK
ncbi:DUF2059 domain-containing protein [Marinobacter sp. 1Y8]